MSVEFIAATQVDDELLCQVIKRVGKEFGAVGEGYGPSDVEVLAMSQHYGEDKSSLYLVAKFNGKLVGGCGVAPLSGSLATCELKKLFLLEESRGLGLGRQLTEQCLQYAKGKGFKTCYLDTLSNMTSAVRLYEKLGFVHLPQPLAESVHTSCDVWMKKAL